MKLPVKSYRKPPVATEFGAFSLQPMSGRQARTSTNHRDGNFDEDFGKHFQKKSVILKKKTDSL
jgi:hypothetical protein